MAVYQDFLCSHLSLPVGEVAPQGQKGVRADRASPLGLLSYNGEITGSISLGPRPRGALRSLPSIKHLHLFSPPSPRLRVLVGSTFHSHTPRDDARVQFYL